MLQSDSKQNINAFVAIYAVMGEGFSCEKPMSLITCVEAPHAQTLFVHKASVIQVLGRCFSHSVFATQWQDELGHRQDGRHRSNF